MKPFRPTVEPLEDRTTPAAVAGGDFNGDGFADLAVGLPEEGVGAAAAAGVVRVWYGSAAWLSVVGVQLWSQDDTGVRDTAEAGDRFGNAVAAGDFNGDGRDDLAVGVAREDLGTFIDTGAVNVLFGSASGLTGTGSQIWSQDSSGIVHGNTTGDLFGASLAAGDFNGDGRDDVVVGMPGNDAGPSDIKDGGGVIVIYGSSAGLTSAGNRAFDSVEPGILGEGQTHEHYGQSLAAGDFNRDGRDDVAIGVPDKDAPGAVDAGAVSVVFGSSSGLTASGDRLLWQGNEGVPDAAEAGDRFGAALAAGDFDGDGRDDLVVGAPREDAGAADAGAVAIVRGSAAGLGSAGNQFWTRASAGGDPAETNGRFGSAAAAADFDGDGFDDLAAAAPGVGGDAGGATVLYGSGAGLTAAGSQSWSQDTEGVRGVAGAGDRFGDALAAADFNADGSGDLAADVPGENAGAGAVGVLYGSGSGVSAAGNQLLTWGGDPDPLPPETLIAARSSWKYLVTGTDPGTAWRGTGFDDSAWPAGAAQFGYGDGDEATVVGYGPRASRKYVTTYFRHAFEVADAARFGGLTLRLLRDDGAVVYLNGAEVFRSNMPTGAIGYTTLAASAVGGADESAYHEAALPAGFLATGTNVVAVEVHQSAPDSSDLSFDLELTATPAAPPSVAAAFPVSSPPAADVLRPGATAAPTVQNLPPSGMSSGAGRAPPDTAEAAVAPRRSVGEWIDRLPGLDDEALPAAGRGE